MLRLKSLTIKNYKSLRNVTFEPGNFSVLVGPNGAGKSNLADALDFLANVYRDGLEMAIQRKGGYENILYRKQRRTKSALEFEVVLDGKTTDFINSLSHYALPASFPREDRYQLTHQFAVNIDPNDAVGQFTIIQEVFIIQQSNTNKTDLYVKREQDKVTVKNNGKENPIISFLYNGHGIDELLGLMTLQSNTVLLANLFILRDMTHTLISLLSRIRIFNLVPIVTKQPGIATPNAEVTIHGDNLPALVDWLQKNVPEKWEQLIEAMQTILPSLDDIKVEYIYNQKLGLFFSENSQGRPWNMEIVSDGTLLSLATLCAAADPRQSITVIEEPENSLHPWALRTLIRQFRKFSQDKQIILTTHSPTLIDMLRPEEIWCVAKDDKGTHIDPLVALDQDIVSGWEDGKFKLSTYLDAGLIPNAIPGGL